MGLPCTKACLLYPLRDPTGTKNESSRNRHGASLAAPVGCDLGKSSHERVVVHKLEVPQQ
jgi:hypothetical protein